jgi:hypothetical protein
VPQMHWPNLRREQVERLALAAVGLLMAAAVIGRVYALFATPITEVAGLPLPLIGAF